ncbi:cytochrome P450, partial [Amycolatopsis rhizosphaerae]
MSTGTAPVAAPRRIAPLPPGPRLPGAVQTVLFGNFRHVLLPLLRRLYGDVIRLNLYPERSVVQLADVEHIKTVFSGPATTFHAGEGNVILKPIMGAHSVLLTDEDVHLRARKLLMPAFHGAALRGYREMITGLAEREVDRWPTGRVFRLHDRMQALTLEIILRVVFGVAEGPRLDELRRLLTDLVDIGVLDLFGWHNEKLQRFGPWRRSMLKQRRVDELLFAEIAERRTATDLPERTDVLSRLLTVPAEDDRLSDAELRDQLVTLLLAGHETTATTLAWSCHELARDPVRLARASQAADSGDEKYLEAVAKEAMRLHPVISEVARRLTRDVEIGGYRIPAGFTVMPSIALVHGDPAHHPDPKAFRPERFLGSGPATGTWFPFGGGGRRCLGAGFSLLEATIVLQTIL